MVNCIPRALLSLSLLFGASALAQQWQPTLPIPASQRSVAFDSTQGYTLLFGGSIFRGVSIPSDYPNDTWRFSAQGFQRLTTAVAPPGRTGASLVHDPVRGRTVLCGGYQGQQPLRDTWEFDGTNWSQRVLPTPVPAHSNTGCVFDLGRGVVVLHVPTTPADEIWEYDGIDWLRRNLPAMPGNRFWTTMAFDVARNRTVLFGGDTGQGFLADTWEYDGTTWQQRTPPHSPPARREAAITYDPVRQRVLMFGGWGIGLPDDTWDYDGTDWTLVPPVLQPNPSPHRRLVFDSVRQQPLLFADAQTSSAALDPTTVHRFDQQVWWPIAGTDAPFARYRHRLAHDSRRNRTLLFGGSQWLAAIGSVAFADLWSWNGTAWSELTPFSGPPAREGHGFAYDAARDRVVLFGGEFVIGQSNETWEFDGGVWTRRPLAVAPSARTLPAMAYDPVWRQVVLFGGTATGPLQDLWTFDGQAWTLHNLPGAPSARSGTAMEHDPAAARLVLFGGRTAAGVVAETWTLSPAGWTQLASSGGPSARTEAALAYDAQLGALVMTGGDAGTTALADAWQLQGSTWSPLPATGAVPRFGAAMVGSPGRGGCLLFGGAQRVPVFITSFTIPMADTWRWQPPAVAAAVSRGVGCAGSAGVPVLAPAQGSTPGLGSTFLVELTSLPANGITVLAWGNGAALPQDLGPYGLPGCMLWVTPAATRAALATNGRATFALPLPATPALAGTHFALQGLSLDANSPSGLGAVSNGLFATAY